MGLLHRGSPVPKTACTSTPVQFQRQKSHGNGGTDKFSVFFSNTLRWPFLFNEDYHKNHGFSNFHSLHEVSKTN
jgi:hypothetical protein